MNGLIYFRRDLRIHDNSALNYLKQKYAKNKIYGIVIYNKQQLELTEQNKYYYNEKAADFFKFCASNLKKQFEENYKRFDILEINNYNELVPKLQRYFKDNSISELIYNCEYTEKARLMQTYLEQLSITVTKVQFDQFLLKPFYKIKPYVVFNAYYKATLNYNIPVLNLQLTARTNNLARTQAIECLPCTTDLLNEDNFIGTGLSKYINFGVISLRQVYNYVKSLDALTHLKDAFLRKLHWRNHFLTLLHYGYFKYSNYLSNIKGSWHKIKWVNNMQHAELLWSGNTGYCLIDAIVKQLTYTGYISNTARLLLANFSIKVLAHDPAQQKYGILNAFSRFLIDAQCANNTGNILWVLGPFDFNGVLYGEKGSIGGRIIDPCNIKKYKYAIPYIKKHIKSLRYSPDTQLLYNSKSYLPPIIDYTLAKKRWYSITNFEALDEN